MFVYSYAVTTLSVPGFTRERTARSASRFRNRLALLLGVLKPVLGNLASVPLTVAGFGCIDCGVFFASVIAGFIVTGLSLILLEYVVTE